MVQLDLFFFIRRQGGGADNSARHGASLQKSFLEKEGRIKDGGFATQ